MAEFCLECWNRVAQGTVLCVMLKLNGEQTRGRGTRT